MHNIVNPGISGGMGGSLGGVIARAFGLQGYGWLFEIIILVLAVLIIYLIVKFSQKKESAIEILKRRYAKGEISKKEYLSLKEDIE